MLPWVSLRITLTLSRMPTHYRLEINAGLSILRAPKWWVVAKKGLGFRVYHFGGLFLCVVSILIKGLLDPPYGARQICIE